MSMWHVHESLCRLSNWNRRYHLIAQSVDCDGWLAVLQCDVDSGTISRWPNSVRKVSYGNRGDQLRRSAAAKRLHLFAIVHEVHVIGDRSCIQRRLLFERW